MKLLLFLLLIPGIAYSACDSTHLNQCITENTCLSAGGNYCDSRCRKNTCTRNTSVFQNLGQLTASSVGTISFVSTSDNNTAITTSDGLVLTDNRGNHIWNASYVLTTDVGSTLSTDSDVPITITY